MIFCVVEKWKWQVTVTEQQFSWDQNCARYKASMPDPAGLSLYKDAEVLTGNNGSEFLHSWRQLLINRLKLQTFLHLTQLRLFEKLLCNIARTRGIYIPEYRRDPDSHGFKPWNTYRAEGWWQWEVMRHHLWIMVDDAAWVTGKETAQWAWLLFMCGNPFHVCHNTLWFLHLFCDLCNK